MMSPDRNDSTKRRVTFNPKLEVQHLHVWNYAYREARKGKWMEIALDRSRFKRRIKLVQNIISLILSEQHRNKIFLQRFSRKQ